MIRKTKTGHVVLSKPNPRTGKRRILAVHKSKAKAVAHNKRAMKGSY